ncbi:peptidyl-prolyl cis-trans isomerase FKBP19, chloroplastic [Tanacetum coccineum]
MASISTFSSPATGLKSSPLLPKPPTAAVVSLGFPAKLASSRLSLRSGAPLAASLLVRCSQNGGNGSPVKRTTLHELYEKQGQSPWYDNLCRPVTDLLPLIESGVRGVTSNPAIFQKAISTSNAYNDQFRELVQGGKDIESAYWELVIKDIQDACKLFEHIYDETDGGDGYVSVEVSPLLAENTQGTVDAAKWLHKVVDRKNVYIKIPATEACVPSIKDVISLGISVNVTLIFSLSRYEAVIDAYLDGLEASGLDDLSKVTSVASFFVSRVDSLVDKMLEKIGTPEALDLRGKAANAQAALAFQLYQKKFSGPRWEALVKKGAKKQRLLWASTSVKNPAYPDTLYVSPLVGPDTVSTMPDQALLAFIDHGTVGRTIDANVSEAEGIYSALEKLGINWGVVGSQLENEGVDSFKKAFDSLLDSLQEKANSMKLVSLCVFLANKWCYHFHPSLPLSFLFHSNGCTNHQIYMPPMYHVLYLVDEKGSLDDAKSSSNIDRRKWLLSSVGLLAVSLGTSLGDGVAVASNFADMPALKGKDYGKSKMKYPDYEETSSGLQYKDLRAGNGPIPKRGDTVVVDWDGYTIGYYGRIFEARNKTKGGSFEGDNKSFYRFRLGSHEVIPAFEEAVAGMSLGGIRRIIVPPDLGYPENDYNKSGPKPTTFSGQRALDFVLRNQGLIDKTLLFDIELLNIIPN